MTVKLTMLFQQVTNTSSPNSPDKRLAGWSESWYFPGTSIPATVEAANNAQANGINPILWARARCLANGAAIVGQRYQVINPAGPSQTHSTKYPGLAAIPADIPGMALLCKVPALGFNNNRSMILRGIPDLDVIEGEFSPNQAFRVELAAFFDSLGIWTFRGRDLSQQAIKLISITEAGPTPGSGGVFQTESAHAYVPNQMVRILRANTADGRQVGGRYQILVSGPGPFAGQLRDWNQVATTGGRIRADQTVSLPVDVPHIEISRVITRRVGRPFGQFRGRRSKIRR